MDDAEAQEVATWARRLGIDRSELLREAARTHLARLAAERDATALDGQARDPGDVELSSVERWAPAEDWSDWPDASSDRSDA